MSLLSLHYTKGSIFIEEKNFVKKLLENLR